MKVYIFLGYSLNSKAYRVLNKRTSMVKESIHVVFDKSDNGTLSEGFKELNLNKNFDDISDDKLDANGISEVKKKYMLNNHLALKIQIYLIMCLN